jgi:hypothetical protein
MTVNPRHTFESMDYQLSEFVGCGTGLPTNQIAPLVQSQVERHQVVQHCAGFDFRKMTLAPNKLQRITTR